MATEYIHITKKTLRRKITERGITMAVWSLMFFLLYRELVENINRQQLTLWIGSGGSIVLVVLFVYTAWGYYNFMKYGRRNRRRNAPHASLEDLAECYQLSVEHVKRMRRNKENTWTGPVTVEVINEGFR